MLSGLTVKLNGSEYSNDCLESSRWLLRFPEDSGRRNYVVTPSVPGFASSPASRSFTSLGESTYTADFVLTPTDSIDTTEVFVYQHYRDFLNREPDSAGLSFWVNNIDGCNANLPCLDLRRQHLEHSFFRLSQETGYLVELSYKLPVFMATYPAFQTLVPPTSCEYHGEIQ